MALTDINFGAGEDVTVKIPDDSTKRPTGIVVDSPVIIDTPILDSYAH